MMSDNPFRSFWRQRPYKLIGKFPLADWQSNREQSLATRQQRIDLKRQNFFGQYNINEDINDSTTSTDIAASLQSWAINKSWTFCDKCKLLHRLNMIPSFSRTSNPRTVSTCPCSNNRYIIPTFLQIPFALHHLTKQDIVALRPFILHTGNYQRHQHGYRIKDGFCRVSWCNTPVLQKISQLDNDSRIRCYLAHRYLTTSTTSRYGHFLNLREQHLREGKAVNLYNYKDNDGIECALWPHLYPFHEWCETSFSGNTTRKSSKIAFNFKLLSEVIDYALDFELLQFHYDRWLFNTVSGAISSCRGTLRSPATALDAKPFSIEYWRWEHRYLIDAVRQYGYPSLFMTISPFEWTFPKPHWLTSMYEGLGKLPTELPSLETINIVHILEQTVRGYLCGTNTKRWKHHYFSNNAESNHTNVINFFYRIEFQHRGTAHVHILVWLKDLQQVNLNHFRADLPRDNGDLSFLVYDLQTSHKTVLSEYNECSHFSSNSDGKSSIKLHYPAEAFALRLRAYLATVLPYLKCSMDMQTTDNKGMVMRYVTDYVAKFKDCQSTDSLYSTHVTPAMAAYRHLTDMKPCEPEMIMTLSSLKLTWTNSVTKRYVPPRPLTTQSCTILQKYHQRAQDINLTLLEYLRTYMTTKVTPTPYKSQTALVGIKYVSYFNLHFFFQYLIVNKVHFNIAELQHPQHALLPEDLKYFAACVQYFPDTFGHSNAFRNLLQREGHKDYYIDNVLAFLQSLKDIFNLWKIQVLRNEDFQSNCMTPSNNCLNTKQHIVVQNLKAFLNKRDFYYGNVCNTPTQEDDSDSDATSNCESNEGDTLDDLPFPIANELAANSFTTNWTKVITITGKPGTGKTRCMQACIEYLISKRRRCLVATPTGYLASTYRSVFDTDIDCETIHSSFCIPIDGSAPKVNWMLSTYDVIFIDEVSMIPLPIFEHVLSTLQQLATRPILVISGDPYQQQPISTDRGNISQTRNIFNSSAFPNISVKHDLVDQFRCSDPEFYDILNHLRHWKPTYQMLDTLHSNGRLLYNQCNISDAIILETTQRFPTATFVTISKAATNRVNNVICSNMFPDNNLLCMIQFDNLQEPGPLYKNMRVIITQNRNKPAGVVNGQPAIVKYREGHTIILMLPSGRHVFVHPVKGFSAANNQSDAHNDVNTCYPIIPGYALTICKCQGQTLKSAVIWFDCQNLGEGSAYVALSRVKTLEDIHFLTPLKKELFKPVTLRM